jgi:hypothetical protein
MSDETAKRHEQMLADALWKTVFYYWQDPNDRGEMVMMPPVQTCNAILKVLAHMVSKMPDPKDRDKVLKSMGPVIEKQVEIYRKRPENAKIIMPETSVRIQ